MRYYDFHINDFGAKTAHLNLAEIGIYTLLINRYYEQEAPFADDETDRLKRFCVFARAKVALKRYLRISLNCATDTGITTAATVIAEYHERCEANRANGKKGGRPRKPQQRFRVVLSPIGVVRKTRKTLGCAETPRLFFKRQPITKK